jgi:hypothetical protein
MKKPHSELPRLEATRIEGLGPLKVLGRAEWVISLLPVDVHAKVIIYYQECGLIRFGWMNEITEVPRPVTESERAIIMATLLAG